VANNIPERIDVAITTGTDQEVTGISRPKIGVFKIAVGREMNNPVATAVALATSQRFLLHNKRDLIELSSTTPK
jgi:hypothetical protein